MGHRLGKLVAGRSPVEVAQAGRNPEMALAEHSPVELATRILVPIDHRVAAGHRLVAVHMVVASHRLVAAGRSLELGTAARRKHCWEMSALADMEPAAAWLSGSSWSYCWS